MCCWRCRQKKSLWRFISIGSFDGSAKRLMATVFFPLLMYETFKRKCFDVASQNDKIKHNLSNLRRSAVIRVETEGTSSCGQHTMLFMSSVWWASGAISIRKDFFFINFDVLGHRAQPAHTLENF